jgi:hypothetical protein
MYCDGMDILRLFDENGNEHLSGQSHYWMAHSNNNITGVNEGNPIISDGPIFIESLQSESTSDWILFRFYANSYIYKYVKCTHGFYKGDFFDAAQSLY